jgi:hypothetical protein
MSDSNTENALLIAGELTGLAMRLDVHALEEFLRKQPAGFYFVDVCRAALRYRADLSECRSGEFTGKKKGVAS